MREDEERDDKKDGCEEGQDETSGAPDGCC